MDIHTTEPADSLVEDARRLFSQPTATELSRLTYGLLDLRLGVQEEGRSTNLMVGSIPLRLSGSQQQTTHT